MMRALVTFVLIAFAAPAYAAAPVVEVVSAGGVKAWLVEEHSQPLVAMKFVFRDSGTAYDPKGKEGRAQLMVGLLDEGAGDLDAQAFGEMLEDHAIQMGFGVDEDSVSGNWRALSEEAPVAVKMLGMALAKPRFDGDAVERVRGQILTLQQQREKSPAHLIDVAWRKAVFGDHPYGRDGMGTAASVKGLSRKDLMAHAERYLARDALVVAVVGDVTSEVLKGWLDEAFAGLPAKADRDTTVADAVFPEKGARVVVKSAVPQTLVMFTGPGLVRKDPDFYAGYVMNHLLGGGVMSSLLYEEIREKRGLSYGVSTAMEPMRHSALWSGGFSTRNEKAGEAMSTLRATLEAFAQKGPTAEQLEAAKQYITGAFMLGLDSHMEVAGYLITMQMHDLGRDYFEKRNGLMQAVTVEQVKAVAGRVVAPARLQEILVGQPVLEEAK